MFGFLLFRAEDISPRGTRAVGVHSIPCVECGALQRFLAKNQVRAVCVNPTVGYRYSQNELTYPYWYAVLCQIGTTLDLIGLPTLLPSHLASRYRYQLWGRLLFMEAFLLLPTALSNRQRHRNLDKLPAEIHSFQFSEGFGE